MRMYVCLRNKTWRANQVQHCDDTIEHNLVETKEEGGEDDEGISKREKKRTCYTPEQLAPALVNVARVNIKMPAKIIKPLLRTLVSNELSASVITRTRAAVTRLIKGNPDELLEHFPAYIAALNDLGHDAECLIVTAASLKQEMLSWAKESHKIKEKGIDKEARTIFDEDDTKELIASMVDDSAEYLLAYEISPSTSRALWAKDVTIPVFNIDFAHMLRTGLFYF